MNSQQHTGILLIAHGSRNAEANDELKRISAMVRAETGCEIVEEAFREFSQPDIQTGIEACVIQGATYIVLIPYFLFSGAHVLDDLPAEIQTAKQRHSGLEIVLAKPLGVHPKLAEVVGERLREVLSPGKVDQ